MFMSSRASKVTPPGPAQCGGWGRRSPMERPSSLASSQNLETFSDSPRLARALRRAEGKSREPTQMISQIQSAAASVRTDVMAALHTASHKTGLDFDYLFNTAMRESNLDTQAKSK